MPGAQPFAREYPPRPIAGVGAVVLVAASDCARLGIDGEVSDPGVVLVRRRYPPLEGEWSLPGGAIELGETLETAIAREVTEETGLSVDVGPVVEVFDRITLDASQRVQHHYVLVDFVCRARAGRLAHGSDASDVAVADPAHLDRYRLTEKARAVIARALEIGASAPR